MNTSAVATMVVIGGFVWGGFVVLLVYGIRREREKRERDRAG